MIKLKQHATLIFLLGLACLFRLPHLSGSLWLDEAAQALESSRPLADQYKIQDDFQPPLFHYLVHAEIQISHSEAFLRLVSLFAGVVSVALIYLLLKDVTSNRIATASAFFLSINPFHIFYSQELRPYAVATMFACLSWYVLVAKWKKENKHVFWFILATVGGLYSMYLYPFVLLSQFIFIVFEKRYQLRSFLISSFISCLFFLPWLPFFIGQLHVGTSLTKDLPGWAQAVATPQLKALPLTLAKFAVGQVELKDSPMYVVLAAIFMLISLDAILWNFRKKETRFLVYWFLVPLLGAWAISFLIPVIQPKRVMIALPALVGMLGVFVADTGRFKQMREGASIVIAILFLSMTSLYYTTPKYQRENWRDVISQIQEQGKGEQSTTVFAFPEPLAPWRWYASGTVGSVSTGMLHVDSVDQLKEPFRQLSGSTRIFVFDYLRDLTDPHHVIEQWLTASGYTQSGLIDGGNVGFVRVFDSR